ncbi:MAG: hypothetical protein CFE23_04510 [Flavobacterium sp. BFFFF1]|uniref:hypothetical protein n=1 Tax=Flavobacterium sp. BFFFF1 TaxID=2015557 RepID=UPI000BD18D43|nr:hypothetical protein [Flavobacterium sp. BFFFF1]OYU81362.1 MAG: hypothetical protein CFE23_04510 [Flavobacterium sp. BFFFF1]
MTAMFHVEPIKRMVFKTACIFFMFAVAVSCASRNKIVIEGYLVLPNGKEILGHDSLNAFVFENIHKETSFQNYLSNKYAVLDIKAPEFSVTIDGSQYKVIVYDNVEFEKYFRVSDFVQTHFDTDSDDANWPKFIAISMINDRNEDCLSETSLYRNVAINYLKNLKQAYYKQ